MTSVPFIEVQKAHDFDGGDGEAPKPALGPADNINENERSQFSATS